MMTLVNFEKACASCHAEQMQGPYSDLAFYAVPELEIGEQTEIKWPARSAEFDRIAPEELPAFMKLLLTTQSQWQEGHHILQRAEDNSAAQRGHQKLAMAVKLLTEDLVENGESALRTRLLAALGKDGPEHAAHDLTLATRPLIETLRSSSQQWFPDLTQELNSLDDDSPQETQDKTVADPFRSILDEGWHVGENPWIIRFRPTQHAESMPKELIDALVQIPGIEQEPESETSLGALRAMFRELTDPRGSFRCIKCHSIDRTADGTLVVNWHALDSDSKERDLVRFSHAPHITLLSSDGGTTQGHDQDCRTCHRLEDLEQRNQKFIHPQYETLAGLAAVADKNTTDSCSGFGTISKAVCTECHTKQLAGNSCLNCHNYHAGTLTNNSVH